MLRRRRRALGLGVHLAGGDLEGRVDWLVRRGVHSLEEAGASGESVQVTQRLEVAALVLGVGVQVDI